MQSLIFFNYIHIFLAYSFILNELITGDLTVPQYYVALVSSVTLLWRLVLHCFGIFWTFSDIVFLQTCDFFDLYVRQVSPASQTLSVSAAVPITYWIRVLEAISAAEQKRSGL